MWQKSMLLLLGYLLLSSCFVDAGSDEYSDESDDGCGILDALPYMVVGGDLELTGNLGFKRVTECLDKFSDLPRVTDSKEGSEGGGLLAFGLPALGFTGAGIAANSVASTLMSWSAVINGGGVPAGGFVATLQSLGAGMSSTALAGVGAKVGYEIHQNFVCQKKEKSGELEG
ncbi:LOW QUALITY PROTEIN: interferon alpha-inducible protein 6 [Gracilinanus agilis]|uniref:LOW QUALITY PROTEIN: interferon alpha-inducible protein 6 n=1 Tax=Gracilinanus agilis TaxID=191870 RepID=UPI001CFE2288|nr:LOW QUALITY PROTEIN: interferon alpha-inducible protein 6 [Gracilinanus agilis]